MNPRLLIILLILLIGLPAPTHANYCASDADGSRYTGYLWVDDQTCVPGMITVRSWYLPAPTYAYGSAVFYGPNVMEATAHYRNLLLDDYLDGVSLMAPSDIGRTVWLRRPGHEWEGPYLVVDSAARQDMWPILYARGEIVEVGFKTAERWGMVTGDRNGNYYTGRYKVHQWKIEDVEVLKTDDLPIWATFGLPAPVEPINYAAWWLGQAAFVNGRDVPRRPLWLRPDGIRPASWKWHDGTILSAYDNWAEFLFPYLDFSEFYISFKQPKWYKGVVNCNGHCMR